MAHYDAILLFSFGGPEGPDDVMPFLRNVTRGRGVPDARLEAVAAHYLHFGGKSPINSLNRALITALSAELATHGPNLPIYFGNRFFDPYVADALEEIVAAGHRRVLAVVTSAFSSYSGCRAYREDLDRALLGLGERAPKVDKLGPFGTSEGYLETCSARLSDALAHLPNAEVLFSAHSIPTSMAAGCAYVSELETLGRRLAERHAIARWRVVYQSRSGPPSIPWLEPDVCAVLETLPSGAEVILAPFGFVADHMEVVYDLDVEARAVADARGIAMVRAQTANAHPRFVRLLRERIDEANRTPPAACHATCCPAPRRP